KASRTWKNCSAFTSARPARKRSAAARSDSRARLRRFDLRAGRKGQDGRFGRLFQAVPTRAWATGAQSRPAEHWPQLPQLLRIEIDSLLVVPTDPLGPGLLAQGDTAVAVFSLKKDHGETFAVVRAGQRGELTFADHAGGFPDE